MTLAPWRYRKLTWVLLIVSAVVAVGITVLALGALQGSGAFGRSGGGGIRPMRTIVLIGVGVGAIGGFIALSLPRARTLRCGCGWTQTFKSR